jgi:RNA polymerase sigma factor (sigma-70 family)
MLLHIPTAPPFIERRARPREAPGNVDHERACLQNLSSPSLSSPATGASDSADAALLARACAGSPAAVPQLIEMLLPSVRGSVEARLRCASWQGDSTRSVEDLCQEVFLQLFADDGKVLRRWTPDKGLSLARFAALVADRLVISELRRKQHSHGAANIDDCSETLQDTHQQPQDWLHSRQCLALLHAALLERLSPLGQHMFELLFVQELEVELISQRLDMGADAVYAWRSRLRKQALGILKLADIEHFSQVHA